MNYYTVGKIINIHGIKGEVCVKPITDFPEKRFQPQKCVYAFCDNEFYKQLIIKTVRRHKNLYLLSFIGLENINDVLHLKNCYLKIKEFQQHLLENNQYYYHEIIGLKVFDMKNNEVGIIKDILQPGANDVWIVNRSNKKDLLIPAIKDVIKKIDISEGYIVIDILEGLDD